jgi:hypothetical protein
MTTERPFFVLLTICLLVPLSTHAAGLGTGDVPANLMALDGRDLRGMDLRGWDLRYSDLDGADLRDADLSGARLLGASLRGARLDRASLRGADLRLADLTGVSLRGADLRNADLSSARIAAVTTDASRWHGATCPDDTVAGEAACASTAQLAARPSTLQPDAREPRIARPGNVPSTSSPSRATGIPATSTWTMPSDGRSPCS